MALYPQDVRPVKGKTGALGKLNLAQENLAQEMLFNSAAFR
jgi:hypothetical protein